MQMKDSHNKKPKIKNVLNKMTGTISLSAKGTGYVTPLENLSKKKDKDKDIEIDFKHLNTALHGDTVEVLLHPKMHGRQTGEISKIISRAKNNFVGVLEKENGMYFLKPDDTKMYTDILIPEENLSNAKIGLSAQAGQKVFVEITSWTDKTKAPIGKVLKVLGRPGDNNVEMHSIAIEKGFDAELSIQAENEALQIKKNGIQEKDYIGRRDFRKILTFTIDPSDAKDFDDAISFQEIKEGKYAGMYEVGIHIADVSYYVKTNSELDKEAEGRGTSVYLVDRTIPMLPEVLSNDLCSLVPNKDRLTMSAVFVIDNNAKIKEEWFGRTVIHSQKRFTYEEAETSIHKTGSPLHRELSILNNLAKKLNEERFRSGAISLEQEEVKFVLDDKGVPLKVIKKSRGDSNKLIEEFMLLANKHVARVLSPKKKGGHTEESVSLYRIHDLPSKEKTEDLAFFLRSLGYKITLKDGIIPSFEINKLLKSLENKNETIKDTVQRAIVRSMAKAIYSTKNIGHYGLAFQYYTHFTSPIRRYPDIIIHRLLQNYLDKNNQKNSGKITHENLESKILKYEKIARISSEQEKRASDAERSSIKYKQVEYMSLRLDQKFSGVISGITEWGIYVEEIETKCEGLVRVKDMDDDFYMYNEKKLELVGQKKKKSYRLGDKVKIKVKAVDLEKKTIDYVLV
jgi:ribonuclease R